MITGGQTDVEERIVLSLSASPACVQHVAVATERVCTTGREEGGRNDGKERRMESLMAILLVE